MLQRQDSTVVAASNPFQPGGRNTASEIRVLLVAEVCIYREGLAGILSGRSGIRVVGTASDAAGMFQGVEQWRPDVILLDAGVGSGAELVRRLGQAAPEAKVVALGIRECPEEVLHCAEIGVVGYIGRDAQVDDLVLAIRHAVDGGLLCTPQIAGSLFRRVSSLTRDDVQGRTQPLTEREREVLRLVDRGLSNKEISRRLQIRLSTVKNHIHHAIEKLKVSGRVAAAALLRDADQRATAAQPRPARP